MPLKLLQEAAKPCTTTMVLRGDTVTVRSVSCAVERAIEDQIPYPKVIGDDPKAIEAHKASDAYKAKARKVQIQRQCVRVAYALDIEFEGRTWAPDAQREWVLRVADMVSNWLSDGEIGEVFSATYAALSKQNGAENQIGGTKQGN